MTIFFYDLSPSFLWPALHQAHCLYHLYTVKPRPPGAMRLRTRGDDFELQIIKYEFNKRNFIVQSLFELCMILYFIVLSSFCILLYTCANVICIKFLLTYLLTYLLDRSIASPSDENTSDTFPFILQRCNSRLHCSVSHVRC